MVSRAVTAAELIKNKALRSRCPCQMRAVGCGWPKGLCSHGLCSPWAPGLGQSWPKTGPLYLALLGLGRREDMLVAMETLRHRDWDSCADSRLAINKVSPHLPGPASHGRPVSLLVLLLLSAKPSAPARDGQRCAACSGEDRAQLCCPVRDRQQTMGVYP